MSPVFTSGIPTQIIITTDSDAAIDIAVEIEGAVGFNTTLYPYNGKAVFHDMRSISEQSLLKDSRAYSAAILRATWKSHGNLTRTLLTEMLSDPKCKYFAQGELNYLNEMGKINH